MEKVFKGLSGLLATVPGFTVLIAGISVPQGQKLLFGGVLEALGCAAFAVAYINSSTIKRFSKSTATWHITVWGLTFVACIVAYLFLYMSQVHVDPQTVDDEGVEQAVIFPLIEGEKLTTLIAKAGGKAAAIERYTANGLNSIIREDAFAYALTMGMLVISYSTIFISLVVMFAIAGIRVKGLT